MKSNFIFYEKNLDISEIIQQVRDNPEDWQMVSKIDTIGGDKKPYGFLPLTMALVPPGNNPKDVEETIDTPLYEKYDKIVDFLVSKGFSNHKRAAFFKLKPGDMVGKHIDDGLYYLKKDRYHLSLQGNYLYHCGGEEHIIEPGTLFWFDNKKEHWAKNIDSVDRITFVFDVPMKDILNT